MNGRLGRYGVLGVFIGGRGCREQEFCEAAAVVRLGMGGKTVANP